VLDRGFFFLVLKNIGEQPATKVVTKIGEKIMGPDGKSDLNGLNLFRVLEFFAPGREFRILVGSATAYFASEQPTKFTAVITYSDQERNNYTETITHDLTVYKDLPYEVVRK
jgi:hypothetical protein